MMEKHIELVTPSVVPLAFGKMMIDGVEKPVLLGVTLQHPPTQIFAQASAETKAYGPRAHVVDAYAKQWLAKNPGATSAEFRIESTIPSLVGFGSDTILALTTAKALAWVNDQDHKNTAQLAGDMTLSADEALAYHGFARGGMLLVEMEAAHDQQMPLLLRRHEIKHKENKAWAVVYQYPRVPEGISESYEVDRYEKVKQAAGVVSAETGAIINDRLWPALEADDIAIFSAALNELKALNEEALGKVEGWESGSAEAIQKALTTMNDNEALFSSETLTGLSAYAFVHGARLSQQMRKNMLASLGYFAGQFAASITDNRGVAFKIQNEDLHFHDYPLPNIIDGISGIGRNTQ